MKALLVVVWLGVLWLAGLIWLAPGVSPVPERLVADEATLDLWSLPGHASPAGQKPAAVEAVEPAVVASPPAPAGDSGALRLRDVQAPGTTAAPSVAPPQDALAAAAQAKIDRLRARQAAQAEASARTSASAGVAGVAPPAGQALPLVMKAAANAPADSALQVVPGSCSRLGLFPDANWATRVVGLLLPGEAQPGVRWRILPVKGKGYYLVVRGLSVEVLSARLESRRQALGGLVSTWVRPESCA